MFKSSKFRKLLTPLLFSIGIAICSAGPTYASENSVVAIDIVIKPDGVMRDRAKTANAALLKDYPQGFALDETHNPHVTLLQRYVKSEDLNKVYEAVSAIVRKEKPAKWKLEAFKYYYGKMGATGLAGIVARTTPEMLRTQKELIEAVAPYAVPTGSSAAFITTKEEPEVDQFTRDFVAQYIDRAAGEKFNPHVTTGIGTVTYLDKLLAEPFSTFSFSPERICVYQLGNYGTARKLLKNLE